MSFEVAGRCKLAKLMAYHKLGYIHRDELITIMYRKCMPYKIRRDRRATAPCLDHRFFVLPLVDPGDLLVELEKAGGLGRSDIDVPLLDSDCRHQP